jgi:hypothetical protein
MTETNPPAQPDKKELRRRILLYLKEAQSESITRTCSMVGSVGN